MSTSGNEEEEEQEEEEEEEEEAQAEARKEQQKDMVDCRTYVQDILITMSRSCTKAVKGCQGRS